MLTRRSILAGADCGEIDMLPANGGSNERHCSIAGFR
jgi:hypothetical protein